MILTSILLALGGIGILLYKNFYQLQLIINQNIKIMAQGEFTNAFLARVDTATNEIAKDLKALRDELAAGDNLTPEQKERMTAHAERLEGIGADPTDPIPEPEG